MKKPIPFDFVIDELSSLRPTTKPMFGCTALYVGEKIMLILREKETETTSNGVWIATTEDHHVSLKKDLPSMRSIGVFGDGVTGWQNIPSEKPSFEDEVMKLCSFILKKDPRIGKIPAKKKVIKKNFRKSK